MTVHASVELLDAMRGVAPTEDPERGPDFAPHEKSMSACGEGTWGVLVWVFEFLGQERIEPTEVVDCPDCIALYPPEIRVRMDMVEERNGRAA